MFKGRRLSYLARVHKDAPVHEPPTKLNLSTGGFIIAVIQRFASSIPRPIEAIEPVAEIN